MAERMVINEHWSGDMLLEQLANLGSLLVPHWSLAWPTINQLSRENKVRVTVINRYTARVTLVEHARECDTL